MNMIVAKVMLLAGIGVMVFSPGAKASEWNQKTVITFSSPVEILGQILPAGTYVFKLADSPVNRHIVQVFNKDENHVFGTFLAIPDYHLRPAEQTIVKFHERAAGSPQAIKAWFYPGRNYGHEFVYPNPEALALARANDTPVPLMPAELTADTSNTSATLDGPEVKALEAAPLKAEKPNGEEAEVADVFAVSDTHASTPHAELPENLPATGSVLPLIGLIGLLSLGGAASLRFAATKSK
jgi:hypothetical protein